MSKVRIHSHLRRRVHSPVIMKRTTRKYTLVRGYLRRK